ncbi:MAG: hypothetical protein GY749_05795, partial [Desulfobacteraceae bacterium]|nr:hypothetical protein [Desulfobacteraceae bacterium]
YDFTGWSGDCSDANPVCTLTMNSDKSVTANFRIKTYTLNIASANGTVSKDPNKSVYDCGEKVTLTAIPDMSYRFDHWEGDATGTTSPLTVTMNKNKNITAVFEKQQIISGHTISLTKGWNIISSYIISENLDMMDVVQPLIDSDALEVVIDEKGNRIIKFFGIWRNNIGNFSNEEGYKIKVSKDTELPIQGDQLQLPIFIPYSKGWNITGYPCTSPQNAIAVLQKLIDNGTLIKVIDENGERIINIFGKWINNIGDFKSGEGYMVKVWMDTGLTVNNYASRKRPARFPKPRRSGTVHFTPVWTGTPYNSMNLWIIGIEGHKIEPGDEIGIFDGDKCVGAGVVPDEISMQNPLSIIVSQDDGNNNGFTQDHEIRFRLWDSNAQAEIQTLTPAFMDVNTGTPIEPPGFKENEDYGVSLDLISPEDINLLNVIQILKVLTGIKADAADTDADRNGKTEIKDAIYLLQIVSDIRQQPTDK